MLEAGERKTVFPERYLLMVLKLFFFFNLGRSSLICWVQLPGTRSSGANAAPTLYKAASKTVFDNARKALTP